MQETTRNLYEQQTHNKRMTIMVMLLFGLFLGFVGFGFDLFITGARDRMPHRSAYHDYSSYDEPDESSGFTMPLPIGTAIAVMIGFGMSFWSMQGGARAVLASTGAQPASSANPSHQQLLNVVDEMRIASGLPMPAVYVVPDPDPNAFATGTRPEKASIAVTQGLLDTLNREELQAVVAHEMSHIRNYDVRLMMITAALVGSIIILADMARRSLWYSGGGKRSSRSNSGAIGIIFFVVWLVGIILAPFIAQLMAMAVSRKREYLADASAAELTRNPLGLASALKKIDGAVEPTKSIKRGTAHICIADPRGRQLNEKEGFFAEMFGTHPPIRKRIMALQAMAYQPQSAS